MTSAGLVIFDATTNIAKTRQLGGFFFWWLPRNPNSATIQASKGYSKFSKDPTTQRVFTKPVDQ